MRHPNASSVDDDNLPGSGDEHHCGIATGSLRQDHSLGQRPGHQPGNRCGVRAGSGAVPTASVLSWLLATTTIERDCPFSRYVGYERTIILLRGGGFALSCDERETWTIEHPGQMIEFSGDRATTCLLPRGPRRSPQRDGPARQHRLYRQVESGANRVAESIGPGTRVVYCSRGGLQVSAEGTSSWSVQAEEALRLEMRQPTMFGVDSVAADTLWATLDVFRSNGPSPGAPARAAAR